MKCESSLVTTNSCIRGRLTSCRDRFEKRVPLRKFKQYVTEVEVDTEERNEKRV